ncbi:kinase-like domain-containing protein [Crucibulum laeve]|uniref:Kinase-like domain-containing protein n=1 Tax=Crucibulum laeve TaxID=68775 RepID=A0A5C3LI49_9AGAR|nr:kinase-like domain-containing protein [Crucibulum laeve]
MDEKLAPLPLRMIRHYNIAVPPSVPPLLSTTFSVIRQGDWEGHTIAVKQVRVYGAAGVVSRIKEDVLNAFKSTPENIFPSTHPDNGIMPLCLVQSIDKLPFVTFISPWMENGSVLDYVAKGCSRVEKLSLILQVARALKLLHENNIVHGNICPGNILITDLGEAVITDCGMRTILSHIFTNVIDRYSAPECVFNFERAELTTMSDVWSFGCVAMELLLEIKPFSACHTDAEIAISLHEQRAPFGNTLMPTVKGSLERLWDILVACFDYNPEARPDMKTLYSNMIQWVEMFK